uniref:Uncharacterized protein n=1 Tax=Cacopsylla melanoneura TaxID=428564 RepID=A0A8D8V0L1_9HEMI
MLNKTQSIKLKQTMLIQMIMMSLMKQFMFLKQIKPMPRMKTKPNVLLRIKDPNKRRIFRVKAFWMILSNLLSMKSLLIVFQCMNPVQRIILLLKLLLLLFRHPMKL